VYDQETAERAFKFVIWTSTETLGFNRRPPRSLYRQFMASHRKDLLNPKIKKVVRLHSGHYYEDPLCLLIREGKHAHDVAAYEDSMRGFAATVCALSSERMISIGTRHATVDVDLQGMGSCVIVGLNNESVALLHSHLRTQ
jgi:hypothetical protein